MTYVTFFLLVPWMVTYDSLDCSLEFANMAEDQRSLRASFIQNILLNTNYYIVCIHQNFTLGDILHYTVIC